MVLNVLWIDCLMYYLDNRKHHLPHSRDIKKISDSIADEWRLIQGKLPKISETT